MSMDFCLMNKKGKLLILLLWRPLKIALGGQSYRISKQQAEYDLVQLLPNYSNE